MSYMDATNKLFLFLFLFLWLFDVLGSCQLSKENMHCALLAISILCTYPQKIPAKAAAIDIHGHLCTRTDANYFIPVTFYSRNLLAY